MKSIYPILSLSLRLIFLNIFFSKTLQDFMDWYQFYFLHDVCLEAISKFIAALWGWYYLLNRSWKQFHLPLKTSKWCIFDADNTFIWESLRHTFLVYLIFLTKLKLNKNSKKKRKTSLKYHHKIFIFLTCLNICILNVPSTIHVHNTKKKINKRTLVYKLLNAHLVKTHNWN